MMWENENSRERNALFAGERNYRRVYLCQRRMPDVTTVRPLVEREEMEFALNIHHPLSMPPSEGTETRWSLLALQEN